MITARQALRTHVPRLYYRLWRAKDALRLRGRDPERWAENFDGEADKLKVPSRCAVELAPQVPDYIDTILILGCAPGRDFQPFQDRMDLWGIDVAPFERIKNWRCKTERLRYEALSVEAFTKRLEASPTDLSRTVVLASLVLCYVSAKNQRRLLRALRANGCRNMIFQDFPSDNPECGDNATTRCFHLPESEFRYRLCFRDPLPWAKTWVTLDTTLPSDFLAKWSN
jgi:hypothetical protein